MTDVVLVKAKENLLNGFDSLFLDLDGVCYLGKVAAPYAPEGLLRARNTGVKSVFITNNSSRTPKMVAEHLSSIDIPTSPEQVINSAITAVAQLSEDFAPGTKVLAVGGEGLRQALIDGKFEVVFSADDKPEAVVQGLSEDITWHELSEAVLAIKAGARHYATNIDATLPKERGEMIGNGSLVAAVTNATKSPVIASGKPFEFIYRYSEKVAQVTRPLAVGDRLDTDIRGAITANIPVVHVLTGVSNARDVMLSDPQERPTYLCLDLRGVTESYPEIQINDGVAYCADACAQVIENRLYLDEKQACTSITLNQYRAGAAAVWNWLDSGEHNPELLELPNFQVRE